MMPGFLKISPSITSVFLPLAGSDDTSFRGNKNNMVVNVALYHSRWSHEPLVVPSYGSRKQKQHYQREVARKS